MRRVSTEVLVAWEDGTTHSCDAEKFALPGVEEEGIATRVFELVVLEPAFDAVLFF